MIKRIEEYLENKIYQSVIDNYCHESFGEIQYHSYKNLSMTVKIISLLIFGRDGIECIIDECINERTMDLIWQKNHQAITL